MSTEQILKFQPDRTLYLRGFDGNGAAATLCQTSDTGFTVYGVFRDMADFCVLVLYDADNIFEHHSIKYLPDFNLSGMVLSFDLHYQGLQSIDSPKYSWIDWAQLDVISATGAPSNQVRLWDNATLASGTYSVAQGTFTFTVSNGVCYLYDRLTLFVNNAEFDFIAKGTETAADVAQWFATNINCYRWCDFAQSNVAVIASADASGTLTLKYARTGLANVSGTSVELQEVMADGTTPITSNRFPGIASGATIYINPASVNGQPPTPYTVDAVNDATTLTLSSPLEHQQYVPYLVEYGGSDGNNLTVYITPRPNVSLQVDKTVLPLTGGSSDVTWHISIDFSALGIDQLRQAWITFAPQLSNGTAYSDTEWTATFSNWSVQDPKNVRTLQIAGPGSLRIGNADKGACTYSGTDWNVQPANNYWRGFSRVTHTLGDSVTVSYTTTQTHDLYLGTSLYVDRFTVNVTLDGDSPTTLDCYLNTGSEVVTRRLLRTAVSAGTHTVTFTVGEPNSEAESTAGAFAFVFDYIEAAVPASNVADPLVTYSNVSPALDFDTDATYKMSPQRLLWQLLKLGFRGQINEYLGVFWWNQRTRVNGQWNTATFDFSQQPWGDGDMATITIGNNVETGIVTMEKFVITWETVTTEPNPYFTGNGDAIANHFVYYINSGSVSMWAEKTGTGLLTIHTRTPNWGDPISASRTPYNASDPIPIVPSGTVDVGADGTWQVDAAASNPINFPVAQWHSDFFNAVNAAGLLVTTSFSMELVNPPDDGTAGNEWQARFADGTPVTTDTGFAHLYSSQCAPIANMTQFQQAAYTQMAGLQSAAGLTPWLQFGEFLWWYFSETALSVSSISSSNATSVQIGFSAPHNMATGDRVVVSGVRGCTSLNGTWVIGVVDTMNLTIPVAPNGVWDGVSGQVRGGSMAYYDAVTSAAAQTALGRALYPFTCQDDDPTVNNGEDAAFLAARLKAHIDSIRTSVLAQYPNTKFELLYPNDVNNPVCLLGPGIPYAQGGRLNAAVNLPPQYTTQQGSGLDRFKVEALSWSATYLNMDLVQQAIVFALTSPMSWNTSDVAYLVPWFNGTCPWPREFALASSRGLQLINLWAYDHLALMSWPLPFPSPLDRSLMAA